MPVDTLIDDKKGQSNRHLEDYGGNEKQPLSIYQGTFSPTDYIPNVVLVRGYAGSEKMDKLNQHHR